jgi:PP-loop superfamily ATP-utilizing enzyme
MDSVCLAYAAHQVLGDPMLAVTALSASYSQRDRREAQAVVARYACASPFRAGA